MVKNKCFCLFFFLFLFVEKVSERLGKGPGGLRRAPGGLETIFGAGNATLENMKKFTEECFAQHVDGAPSTAPSKISAEQRLIMTPSVTWSLHQGSNDVLN